MGQMAGWYKVGLGLYFGANGRVNKVGLGL